MSQKQQSTSRDGPLVMDAIVKSVLSGDTLVLAHPTRTPPPEKTLTLAHIQVPRLARRNETTEEPFAFEAREFVRKKCIGKPVKFRVDYQNASTGRDFGSVFVYPSHQHGQPEDLAVSLLREGLATLKGRKAEDQQDEYSQAMEQAKNAGRNLWSDDEDFKKMHTRVIKQDKVSVERAIKALKNKPTSVIVEHVFDGHSLRVQLPDNHMVRMILTGVASPSIRYEEQEGKRVQVAQPYAQEALRFAESRLLHRDVIVVFDGVDKFGNFMGTILHSKKPKNNDPGFITFQEELLSRGLARVVEWSVSLSKYVARLKRAEDIAKKQKLKIWEDYEAPESTLTSDDKGVIKARAIEVVTGDSLLVRNMRTQEEERIFLSSIRAPRVGYRNVDPEPWSYEAQEYIRSKVAGKVLHITVDYRRVVGKGRPEAGRDDKASDSEVDQQGNKRKSNGTSGAIEEERRYCTVLVDNKLNLNVGLVSSGLATVVRHSQNDERSPHYFQLLQAEKDATDKRLCVHGKKKPPTRHLTDLTRQSTGQAQKHFALLKDKQVKAVVERVHAGTRFKIALPTEYVAVNFSLSGISSPFLGSRNELENEKPFARDALAFSQDALALRQVDVLIESLDKSGTFLGQIFVGGQSHGIALLREGLAMTLPVAQRFKNWSELSRAEDEARTAKKNIWSLDDVSVVQRERKQQDPVETDDEVEEVSVVGHDGESSSVLTVRVTEVLDGNRFFYQTPDSAEHLHRLEEIMSRLSLDSSPAAVAAPAVGDLCFAKFALDNKWYRARVISTDAKSKTAHVFYVDFGNEEQAQPWSSMRPIDSSADGKSVPFQAKPARLSFVSLDKENMRDQARAYLSDLVFGRDLRLRKDYKIGRTEYVTLIDPSDNTNINSMLVRSGLVFVCKPRRVARDPAFKELIADLELDLEFAKKQRTALWEYGDVHDEVDDHGDDYDTMHGLQ